MALLDSPAPREVTEIAFAADNPGTPAFTTRTIDGPAEAQELGRVLFE